MLQTNGINCTKSRDYNDNCIDSCRRAMDANRNDSPSHIRNWCFNSPSGRYYVIFHLQTNALNSSMGFGRRMGQNSCIWIVAKSYIRSYSETLTRRPSSLACCSCHGYIYNFHHCSQLFILKDAWFWILRSCCHYSYVSVDCKYSIFSQIIYYCIQFLLSP